MMAHDSTPRPGAIAGETIDAVRSALLQQLDGESNDESLRLALRGMAAEAREKGVPPEQLLVVLKDIWYSSPGVRGMSEPADQIRRLQRVVTICIKEYYGD
ncbi:MAG: hypothetical protein ACHQWU_11550 [Gemmatimonadales bacterium]|jgi:hypothetical protein